MTYILLSDLVTCLTSFGIPVIEVDGWQNRGRPSSTGAFNPSGVLCHHTASPTSASDQSELNVILSGNSEAPGPISQLLIGRESHAVYVVAAGRANHAGSGRCPWLGQQKVDGNANMIGIEVSNNGVGEHWPDWQTELYAQTVHALITWYGWPIDNVLLHYTFSQPYYPGSKCDPAGPWMKQPDLKGGCFDMTWNLDTWRSFVTQIGNGNVPPPEDNDMGWIGPYLIQATGKDGTKAGAVYSTDGMMQTLRWLNSEESLAGYRWTMRYYGINAPELEDNAPILAVDTINAYGVVIGDVP
jgi:hypothetical protein